MLTLVDSEGCEKFEILDCTFGCAFVISVEAIDCTFTMTITEFTP
jgi:hypothetical protein